MNSSEVKIFQSDDGKTEIQVKLENETVWLSQKQMADLFEKDTDTIGLHLKNIYSSSELDEQATTEEYSVVQIEGTRKVRRNIKFYNLDAIFSIGYRVNSKRGIQFRIWATRVLKEFLIKGYALNEKLLNQQNQQLLELKNTVKMLGKILDYKKLSTDESTGLLKLVSDYAYALDILDQYDYQKLSIGHTTDKETFCLDYNDAIEQIQKIKKKYDSSPLFGNEKDKSFRSSVAAIYQTFDGKDLYPSIEEKAAHLFYFILL